VDVNTASVALLARISGLNATLAQNIVNHRDENGAFKTRAALKKVARLGEKTFEQAAGFLRVMNGDNPLDSSAVHPEAYPLVQRIAAETDRDIRSLISDAAQRVLEHHSWPGNTRELENVIHFALLVSSGDEILPEHLNLPVAGSPLEQVQRIFHSASPAEQETLRKFLHEQNGIST
jgi:competence ComEA-like helix-hairpin-helix protein